MPILSSTEIINVDLIKYMLYVSFSRFVSVFVITIIIVSYGYHVNRGSVSDLSQDKMR